MLLTLLLSAAHAHRPHAVISAMVLTGAGDGWSLLDREGAVGLLRTGDDGSHWDFVGGPPVADDLVDLALLGEGADRTLAAVSTEGRIWMSDDDGASWRSYELGSRANAVAAEADSFAVACATGLLRVSTGGAVTSLSALEEMIDVTAYEGGVLGVSVSGAIVRVQDKEQTLAALPAEVSPWTAVDVEGEVIAGTTDGAYALREGGWEACGALPVSTYAEHSEEVPLLVYNGEQLLAASGLEAVFVSTDSCRTWTLYDSELVVGYGGTGFVETADQAWSGLVWRGDRVVISGFSGVSSSSDGGLSFREAVMLPGDSMRGVSFDHQWPSRLRLWFGGYGGGAWFSDDGGITWTGSAVGLDGTGAYGSAIYSYGIAAGAEGAFFSGALIPYYSADGLSWSELDLPMPFTTTFDQQRDRLLAFGGQTGREVNLVSQSLDGGLTWEELEALNSKLDGAYLSQLRAVVADGEEGWLATPAAGVWAWYSTDLESWQEWPTDAASGGTAGATTWPPDTGERLVVVSRQGQAWLAELSGGEPGSWRAVDIPFSGDIELFEAADDGTLLVIDRVGQLARSDDGGETWEQVGQPVPAPVTVLTAAPDFAALGAVMIGTWAGTWWSTDRGETVQQLPRYVRYEDGSVMIRCTTSLGTPCETYSDASQGAGGGLLLGSGDLVQLSLPGIGFTILGGDSGDSATLVLDGELHKLAGEGPHVFSGLSGGWHDVDLSTEGSFHLDAVEIDGEGVPMSSLGGDTGSTDGGSTDGGTTDGGTTDGGTTDGGTTDGGTTDGGTTDGGTTDGGTDSAAPSDTGEPADGKGCGCSSARGGTPAWLGLLALALVRRRSAISAPGAR